MTAIKISVLGFTVPDALLELINAQDRLSPSQTHRFAWSLTRALRENGAHVELLSVAPVSDYPGNRRILWRRSSFRQSGVDGTLLPFINLTVLKHVSRYVACRQVAAAELRRFQPDWLLVHGVHSPFLWFAVWFGRREGLKTCAVMTDPPGVARPEDGRLKSLLKRFDIALVTRALRRFDAAIVLAEPLACDFAGGVRRVVVEGLLDTSSLPAVTPVRERGPALVAFAGGLHKEYGVKNLVEAFEGLPGRDVRLETFGRGALEGWIVERSERDARIERPRLVPPRELPEIYARATVLVQPRQVNQDFVPYSFPSKLIEYMASGAVVVSTRLPSIPAEYEPFVVWSDDTVDGLRDAITQVLAWAPAERAAFGERASTFVRTTRCTQAQGARIVSFLSKA